MLTRREVVIEKPFRDRRYREHRRKVVSARPRIDARPPPDFPHLELKLKKLRLERDRQGKICRDNLKLVHRLAFIMRSKRLDNINTAPRGPFEPRRRPRPSALPPCPRSEEIGERRGEERHRSLLEQVTFEAERRITPAPPGRKVQHRAPAGVCRVPRVGPPPPPPRSPPRSPVLHRSRPPPSPSPPRSPVFDIHVSDFVPPRTRADSPEASSSAVGDDDGDEGRSEMTGGDLNRLEVARGEVSRSNMVGGEVSRSEEESEDSDLDAHVTSVLLTGHPDITISEPSDDEFYT